MAKPLINNQTQAISSSQTSFSGNVLIDGHASDPAGQAITVAGVDGKAIGSGPKRTSTIAGDYGQLTMLADGSYTYTLNPGFHAPAGQSIVEDFQIKVRDGTGLFTTITLKFAIAGDAAPANHDVAVVSANLAGAVVEDGVLNAGGTISFTDADLADVHTATVAASASNTTALGTLTLSAIAEAANSADGSFTWSYALDNGAAQSLAEGQQVIEKYLVTIADGHGGSVTREIAITITGTGEPLPTTTGTVVDGYIADALVFRDANNNGVWDHEAFVDANGNGRFDAGESYTDSDGNGHFTAEAFAFTDAQGLFAGLGGTGRIVMAPIVAADGTVITKDISTGKAFTGTMTAADGASVVSPLTTLVDALAGANADPAAVAAAQAAVKAALGLPAEVDLATYDPIDAVAHGGNAADAIAVQKAAVQVANILAVVAAAAEASGAADGAAQAAAALAAQLASGNPADLSSSALVSAVLGGAGAADAGGAIAQSLANVNAIIDQTDAHGDPLAALAAIVAAQIVAQGDLAQAAAQGNVDADDYSGAELIDAVDHAAGEVQVIIPSDPGPQTVGTPGRPSVDDGARISAAEAADGIGVTVAVSGAGFTVGDTLRLTLDGAVVASHVLAAEDLTAGSHAFTLSAATLGADGAKALTAQVVSAGGVTGAVSLPALITLDTHAPNAPAQLSLSEGGLLDAVEAADGTRITGTTEAGSTIAVTLTNGGHTITRAAIVEGTGFHLDLSPADLALLGEGKITFTAVATDAAGNASAASAAGTLVYLLATIVDADSRIDGTGHALPQDDDIDGAVRVVALAGGGFANYWIADVDGDHEGDTVAIQRFDAAGNKQGDVVLLKGLDPALSRDEDAFGSHVEGLGITALSNGGYAVAFGLEAGESVRSISNLGSNGQPVGPLTTVSIVGRPSEIFVASAPNGTFFLQGVKDGALFTVPLTLQAGRIAISDAVLSQFTPPDRLTLVINNVAPFAPVSLTIVADQSRAYAANAALDIQSLTTTAQAQGFAGSGSASGIVEAFHIDSATAASSKQAGYLLQITAANGPGSLDLSGLSNTIVLTNGTVQISGLQPDASGLITVPAHLLAQLERQDASVVLIASNLAPGSSLSTTMMVRESSPQLTGVYLQTFDANGNAVAESAQLDGPGAALSIDDFTGGLSVIALPNGGHAVYWGADVDGDGASDTLAIQRFDTAGHKDGAITLLQGAGADLTDGPLQLEGLSVTALENGGYALSYAVELADSTRTLSFSAPTPGTTVATVIAGRPETIVINSAPAGVTYALSGTKDGAAYTIPLVPQNGVIELSKTDLAQFSVNDRFQLLVTGIPSAQTVNLSIAAAQTRSYDAGDALHDEARSVIVNAAGIAPLATANGRIESFDLDAFTVAPGKAPVFTLQIFPANGVGSVNLTGLSGVIAVPNSGLILVNGLQPGANGVITVPQTLLDRLGTQDVQIVLAVSNLVVGSTLTGSISVREPTLHDDGVYVQTFGHDGAATSTPVHVDDAGSFLANYEDVAEAVSVSALPGGGFAVQWAYDADGDNVPDGIAVQRFDAAGAKQGTVVHLDGIAPGLQAAVATGLDTAYALTALENGGYALSYAVQLDEGFRQVSTTGNGTPISVILAGHPEDISVSAAPAGASFVLSSVKDGVPVEIPLTVSGGKIHITDAMLAQFGMDDRMTLRVDGVGAGQQLSIGITTLQTRVYAGDHHAETVDALVAGNGQTALASGDGRVDSFDIKGAVAGGTPSYAMIIAPALGQQLNLAGISGAIQLPLGVYIGGLLPDANGVIAVPAQILAQLGHNDAQVILVANGLQAGSTLHATMNVADATFLKEGVYVQTFDAAGHALANGLTLTGTAGNDTLIGDKTDDVLQGLGGDNVLTGGDGHDVFRFANLPDGSNVITDFTHGSDVIDLSGFAGTLDFIGGNAFHGVAGEVRFDYADGTAVVSVDLDGDLHADFQIALHGVTTLGQEDFLL